MSIPERPGADQEEEEFLPDSMQPLRAHLVKMKNLPASTKIECPLYGWPLLCCQPDPLTANGVVTMLLCYWSQLLIASQ